MANVEQRLNNLQPTGEVQNQLTTLSNRVNTLEINVRASPSQPRITYNININEAQ